MSNINLLPEELRRKEEKEMKRLAKKPRRFEIELKMPEREKPVFKRMDTAKAPWWKKFVGAKAESPAAQESRELRVPRVYQPQYEVDLLSAKKPAPIRMREARPQFNAPSREVYSPFKPAGERPPRRKFSWSELFGKPSFPIIARQPKIAKPETRHLPAEPARPALPQPPRIKMARPGFLNLLRSWLIGPQKPAKPMMFPAPRITPPPAPRPVRPPLPVRQKKSWWQALFAPRPRKRPEEIAFVNKQKMDLRRRPQELDVRPRKYTGAPRPSIIRAPRKYFADSWARVFSFSRAKSRREDVKLVHEEAHRPITIAPLPKPPVPHIPKIKKPSLLSRLFKPKPKLPKPAVAPKPIIPAMPKIKKPSFWSNLFKRKPKLPKTFEIKPAMPKPILPPLPKVKKPSLLSGLFKRKPKLPKPASARMGYGEAKPIIPPKPAAPIMPKIRKPSLWSRLFKHKPKLPKPILPPKPEIKQLEPTMLFKPQLSAKPQKPSAWSGLFKHEPKPAKPAAPKPIVVPKPASARMGNGEAKPAMPKIKKLSLWSRLFKRKPKLPKPIAPPKPVVPPMPKIKKPSIFFRLFQRKPKLPKTIEIKPASVRMDSGEAKPASARMGYGEAKPGKQIEIKREKSSVEKAGILETMPLAAKDIKKFIKDTYKLIPKIEKREFGVNLMPSELAAKETGNRQYQLAVIVCAIVIPAVIVYASHLLLKSAQAKVAGQIAGREQKLAELNASLKQYEKDQLKNQALRQKLLTAKKLLDDRIYWQGFFDQLEKYTLDGVYYTDLRLDTSGQLTLPVVANSYETGAKQIVAFREAKDFIANVEVNSLTLSGDPKSGATGVSFTVKLSLVDHLFEQPAAATTTADAVAR